MQHKPRNKSLGKFFSNSSADMREKLYFLSIADFAIVVYFRRGLLAESPSETDQLIVL
jgi:hypothetical protein